MNIYVGNLPYTTTDEELRKLFEPYGEVKSATVIMDRATGRSKGFGFVEMATREGSQAAIDATNNMAYSGRNLKVNEARPREERGFGGGGGGGGGWGGGGGGGYGGGGGGYGGGGGGRSGGGGGYGGRGGGGGGYGGGRGDRGGRY
jgi:RNA recognition motif-containing protein